MKSSHRKQTFTQRRLNTALLAGAGTVNQTGRVLAVTDDSMTAQSIDGLVRTYQLTPATAKITDTGAQTNSAPGEFAVNQVVTIVATVNDGTATATAVADQRAAAGLAPPMEG